MPVLISATEVSIFSSISCSAQTILDKKLIETIEFRLPTILNNYFTSDGVQIQVTAKFNPIANTIAIDQNSWDIFGFKNGDPIYVYSSYRNDGYKSINTFSSNIAYVNTAYSVIDESFPTNLGRVITFALVYVPLDVKMVIAEMIAYDYDVRPCRTAGIKSRSLGPLSETYTIDNDNFGYPLEILNKLERYKLCRLN
jgi:hypothetical protein